MRRILGGGVVVGKEELGRRERERERAAPRIVAILSPCPSPNWSVGGHLQSSLFA